MRRAPSYDVVHLLVADPGHPRGMGKIVASVVGGVLTLVGIVLFPLPGPGLLLMVAGLALLARHHDWAQRRVERLRRRALLEAARGVQTRRGAALSLLTTSALAASGLLWLWAPAQPAWWVLPAWTWLPGGFWAGISQTGSGLVTLGLVVHAYRRFHGRPDELARLEDGPNGPGKVDELPPSGMLMP